MMSRHFKQFSKQTLAMLLATTLIFQNVAVANAQSFNVNDLNALRGQPLAANSDTLTPAPSTDQPQQPQQLTEKEKREKQRLREKPSLIEKDYATQLYLSQLKKLR